jgi:hypothetical protein
MKVRKIDEEHSVLDFFLSHEWLIDLRKPGDVPIDMKKDEMNRRHSVYAEESMTMEQLEEQYKNLSLDDSSPNEGDTLLDVSWDHLSSCLKRIHSICQTIEASTQKYISLLDKRGLRSSKDVWPRETDTTEPKSHHTQSSNSKEAPLKQRISKDSRASKGISNVVLFGHTLAKQLALQHGLTLVEESRTLHGDSTMSWLIKDTHLMILVKNSRSQEEMFYNHLSKFNISPALHGHLSGHGLSAYLLPRLLDLPSSLSTEKLMQDCFRILAVLEKEKFIHGDIKPSHLKYDPNDNRIKLIDYDLSVISNKGVVNRNTGTTGYRAPEVEKECRQSHSSDVWSMGVTLKELCKNEFKNDELEKWVNAMCDLDYHHRPSGKHLESFLKNVDFRTR